MARPKYGYHGTSDRNLAAIARTGLVPQEFDLLLKNGKVRRAKIVFISSNIQGSALYAGYFNKPKYAAHAALLRFLMPKDAVEFEPELGPESWQWISRAKIYPREMEIYEGPVIVRPGKGVGGVMAVFDERGWQPLA